MPEYDLSWTIATMGSVGGPGNDSLVWQQSGSDIVEIEFLQNGAPAGGGTIAGSPFGAGWAVVGAAGLEGGGAPSGLIYRDLSTGLTEIQYLSGLTATGGGALSANPFGPAWNIVCTGDFTGDGDLDLAWQNSGNQQVEIQLLNGTTSIGGGIIANNPFGAGWVVVAAGNFGGTGQSDLVWQNQASGLVELQYLSGASAVGGGAIADNSFGPGWTVVGVGNFNGGSLSDLVWQNQANGQVDIQFLDGAVQTGAASIANSGFGPGWNVVGAGNFNGGGADLIYRNATSGVAEVQLLNGTTPIGGGVVAFG